MEAELGDLVVELRGLQGELSSAAVPEKLMRIPITHAMAWLEQHARACRQPITCPHTPGSLRFLLKVPSKEAILASSQRIHAELWRDSPAPMIREVREQILGEQPELASALEQPGNAAIERIREELTKEADGVFRVAAILWARGLETAHEQKLFRLLTIFLPERDSAPLITEAPAPGPSEKQRHKRRREAAEARVVELEREVRELRAGVRERAAELGKRERELERIRQDRHDAERRRVEADAERSATEAQIRDRDSRLREITRDAQRSQEANTHLRRDLDETNRRLQLLERERGRLTRELALARTRTESLEAALRALPRGKEAMAQFLRAEEQRIDQDLTILQGGDRRRAEEEHAKREKLEAAFREAYPEYVPPRPAIGGTPRQIRFTALGGGAEVGRSAYLIEIGSSRILVDCGLAVGRTDPAEMVPDIEEIGRLDALVLTHAHTDHIGWVPALIRRQDPAMPIYCSEDTADITPIMLDDARGHYERMLARQQINASHNPHAAPVVEQYTRDDLYDVETRLHALRYDDPLDLPGTALRLTLFPAGHILGAAGLILEGGGRRIVVSGDISSQWQETVGSAAPPRDLADVDLLILESTYGDRVRSADDARQELMQFITQTTERGTAVLPCFALGRGQEVLQILLRGKREGELDRDVSIWVDGLIRRILPLYVERGRVDPGGYQVVGPGERGLAIADCQRPDARAVVVTTSGMLNGGPVVKWADALLRDPRHRLAVLGYQDESSAGGWLGRQLRRRVRPPFDLVLSREEGDELRLRIAGPVREISLSAHADQAGLIDFAKALRPQRIALVHGDPRAQHALAERLSAEMRDVIVSRPGGETLTVT